MSDAIPFLFSNTRTCISYQDLAELNEIKRLLLVQDSNFFAQFNGILPALWIQEATQSRVNMSLFMKPLLVI